MTSKPLPVEQNLAAFREVQEPVQFMIFDFDGVFTDNLVYVFQDGREAVRCSRLDGIGLRRLERTGVEPYIVSTEINPVVIERAAKLMVQCVNGVDDKVAAVGNLLAERGLSFAEAGFVGNDVNDLPLLRKVALPIVVADAHPDTLSAARFRTRRLGGQGAVREVCDAIAVARGVGVA